MTAEPTIPAINGESADRVPNHAATPSHSKVAEVHETVGVNTLTEPEMQEALLVQAMSVARCIAGRKDHQHLFENALKYFSEVLETGTNKKQ